MNQLITNPKRTSHGYRDDDKREHNFNLSHFNLKKGEYKISIQSIKSDKRLNDIDIEFSVSYRRIVK